MQIDGDDANDEMTTAKSTQRNGSKCRRAANTVDTANTANTANTEGTANTANTTGTTSYLATAT